MIELQEFSIGYGERKLLTNINVKIDDCMLTALIGHNGSGKSTLLRAIAGVNHNYSGNIILNGIRSSDMTPEQLAKNIAFVSTERLRIPNLRCYDVVAIGRAPYTNCIGRMHKKDKEIVEHSLLSVGMSDFANKTMDKMSDGECQRVMIARALAQATPIILLDEPTSFLDLPNRYELCSLLVNLAHQEGKCILYSTHELDIAFSYCEKIALIDTPYLHCISSEEMRASEYIELLFRHENIEGTFHNRHRN